METRTLAAWDAAGLNQLAIEEGADLLRSGGIVAFPTETVYGLGANALCEAAVSKIFKAKGRPANNPLIVHVENVAQARNLTVDWTADAELLTRAFWPGPLAIILKKADIVPSVTTAGGQTVAIRCPDHAVALALIHACGFPIAAPSANKSNAISPTTAAHVAHTLSGRIPLILDGGPSSAGIESTVIDLSSAQPRILRPGIIGAEAIEEILNSRVVSGAPCCDGKSAEANAPMVAPGQLAVHYAPSTPMFLLSATELIRQWESRTRAGISVGCLCISRHLAQTIPDDGVVLMPDDPIKYAQLLYQQLHQLDSKGYQVILCETPPDGLAWTAIRDRLSRAASSA